jgi:uncharacterized Zn finger protein
MDGALSRRVEQAFAKGAGHGLLRLDAAEVGRILPPVFAYWRGFGARYVASLCTRPDVEERRTKTPPPSEDDLDALASAAPAMPGGEYLGADVLRALWGELDAAFSGALADSGATVQDFLKSDFSNRLPRGRTYVRNGSVLDLQIAPGEVKALVSGSAIYKVAVKVAAVPKARWASICADCAGAIDSLVELLQGRLSKGVMERICRHTTGLFPTPAEIQFSCSCPDWASMCKHVAAVLYGIGARLDGQPECLFTLRKVDEKALIAKAGSGLPLSRKGPAEDRVLAADGLSELFGLEMAATEEAPVPETARPPAKPARARRAAQAAAIPDDTAPPTRGGRRASSPGTRTTSKARSRTKAKKRSAAKR